MGQFFYEPNEPFGSKNYLISDDFKNERVLMF